MINRFFFLFSALVFLIGSTSSGVASLSLLTHTQHTPELKPASLNNSYQLASVCFLGDGCGGGDFGKGDEPYEIDTTKQCMNEGFVNSCSTGYCMDHSCPYNGNYGKCLKENCPTNSSTTCTGAIDGKNACGVDCKKCCVSTCPDGYDYSESQLTGSSGNGWVKDGNDYCDHCTRGKLYKRKAATCSVSQTCNCGGSGQCKSGNNTYYASCNCCSSCSGSTSTSGMRYYNSCYNSCTGQTLYTERSCDDSGRTSCPSSYWAEGYQNECGNTVYNCYSAKCTNYTRTSETCVDSGEGYWFSIGAYQEKRCQRADGSTYTNALYSSAQKGQHTNTKEGRTYSECMDNLRRAGYYGPGEYLFGPYYD